ncbi:hypothetical protein HW45_03105 [Vibrio sp. ER1A]|nr:hypothetical protein HW45_03105 [Vibrio sp. ER1A]
MSFFRAIRKYAEALENHADSLLERQQREKEARENARSSSTQDDNTTPIKQHVINEELSRNLDERLKRRTNHNSEVESPEEELRRLLELLNDAKPSPGDRMQQLLTMERVSNPDEHQKSNKFKEPTITPKFKLKAQTESDWREEVRHMGNDFD